MATSDHALSAPGNEADGAGPEQRGIPDHEIVIVGAGFSGIGSAIKLVEAGFNDFVILDDGDGVGGTWHWNRYPGVAVDIPSYSYQFSFEKRATWSRTYANGAELADYASHCVDKYGLRGRLRLNTNVQSARFDEAHALWRLSTQQGDISARFVINASGALTTPKMPDIEGIELFAGSVMHSARWDDSVDFSDARVGIIGTGASAVQIIPAIAPRTRHLTVFQRTPIWCMPKLDLKIPGAVQTLIGRIPALELALRVASEAFVEITFPIVAHYHKFFPVGKLAQQQAKLYLYSQVKDPALREKLLPTYTLGCKRPSFHNSYYAAYNRANVHLETNAISRIDERGVVTADGATHELDVLILATGFKIADPDANPTYELIGNSGQRLADWWDANRLQAYEGVSVPGFPNHFSVYGPYGYNGSSYFNLIETQAGHIVRCLNHARATASTLVEIKPEANSRFFEAMLSRRYRQIFWQKGCCSSNSYYFDKHGDVPIRPTTTWNTARRAKRFPLDDYRFTTAHASGNDRAASPDTAAAGSARQG
ncbi:flavin-containing monooxygenase [Mycolicibacter hiberniae]|uniref:Monoxygenase n=1 Tax=Mycolicibacter hiberniae TaxID=29314 RepID=A0A7I7X2R2_9MYCO|nr:NAD(P)/FAD-dependent oxidoreductase [Mycolicibacter hiberniae]MCV7088012.1 NAD(P)/FAD-dependent oxidoreductase [Mycolicibacter hiberniae]BBZ23752.1 monoxygenase [Mycolicibacter hiberniae]